MAKLKLGSIPDDRPVKIRVALSGELHALLIEYARAVAAESRREISVEHLIPRIVERFIRTDRAFVALRKTSGASRGPIDSTRLVNLRSDDK